MTDLKSLDEAVQHIEFLMKKWTYVHHNDERTKKDIEEFLRRYYGDAI